MMQPIVNKIHLSLLKKNKTIGVAESCTGGLISTLLTQIPGSSAYFILGVVAYSNKAKETILGIPHSLIGKKGAVSKEIAQKMAEAIRNLAKTDFGLGITGIAGPGGGTCQKAVGTVFIALHSVNKKICKNFYFKGNRNTIRKKAALKALKLLESSI